jgi:hypothetical protein
VNSATSSNTANTIVKRNGSGGFAAGEITATSVTTGTLTATSATLASLQVTSGTYTVTGSTLTNDAFGNATWSRGGLYNLNGVSAVNQTLSTTISTTSTSPTFVSGAGVHTLNIPLASVTGATAGLLSNTDYQTFSGKQGTLTQGSGISISGGTISATGITSANLSATAGITNGQLANSSVTLGSTAMSLGGTYTSVTGLSSVTSTGFTGALTGNASTATALATPRSIYGNDFNGTAALSGVISTTFGGTGASTTSQNFVFAGPASGSGAPSFRQLTSADVPAGSGNYIANGTTQQASSNFNISGSGVVGTSLSAGSLSLTTALTAVNGGTGQSTYATGDILYASAANTLSKLTKSSDGQVLTLASGIPSWGSNGLVSLNGIASGTQSLTTGTTGTDFNISSSGSTHTFNLPDASTTARGAVTTGTQTFAGNKTFSGTLSTTSLTATSGLIAGNVTYPIAHGSNGQVLSTTGSGTLTWTTPFSGGLTGTGTQNYLPKYGSGGTTLGNSSIFDNGTSVGINTTSPGSAFKLDVNGAANFSSELVVNSIKIGRGRINSGTSNETNTAVGASTLNANTTGVRNAAFGYFAMTANTTGLENTAFGYQTLRANTIGNSNLAFGQNALSTNTEGSNNTALGNAAMESNIIGNSNTAVGSQALNKNKNSNNTAVGQNAMWNNVDGNNNTAVGLNALYSNGSGTSNTAVGVYALQSTTGTYNTAIGYNARVLDGSTVTNATAIGNDANASASNTIQLGNSSVISVNTSGALTTGTVTYPRTHGSSGQILSTSGSGTLTWTTPSAITTISGGTTGLTPSTATSGSVTLAGTLTPTNGGTGQSSYTNGQLLIGNSNGNTLTKALLTQGTGVTITNGNGSITISATGSGGTVTSVNPISVTASGSTFTSTVTNASTTPSIALTIPLASVAGTTAGLLSKADYDIFNAKQGALTQGSGISISGGTISATGITSANLSATAGITNGQLANSAITLGSTSMSLGSTNTTIAGLTSVTSTGFTGALTGNASTATALATPRSIYGNDFDGTAAISGVISTTFGGTGASTTSQNFVFAGPASGSGAPSFRQLTSADVPAGSGNYIANGTMQQASSNFNISGSGVVGTSLSAGSLSLTTALTAANGGTGQSTYATGDILYASAANTLSKLNKGTDGQVLTLASGIPSWGNSSGLVSLNGITSGTQSFTTGTTGTDFNISSSGSTHTFNLPDASTTARGAVTTGTQTFAGNKTFSGSLSATTLTATSGLTAGTVTYPIAHGTNGQVLTTTGSGTLTWTAPSSGGVTSISGGTTGLTPASATSGNVTLAGTLAATNGGTGQSSYAIGDILYASSTNALSKLTKGSEGQVLIAGSTGVPYWGANGLSNLNGVTISTQTFATPSNTTTSDIGWSSNTTSGAHTLNIPDASVSRRGTMGITSQTFRGDKSFENDISSNGVYIGKGTNARTGNIAIGSSGNVGGKNFSTNTGTSAINNIAIGVTTLSSLVDGYSNNAVGNGALSGTNGGYQNNAFGFEALKGNTTGDNNSGFGHSALQSNSTGNNNTAVGFNSLVSTTGSENTAIGSTTSVTGGKSNSTAIGYGATVSTDNTIQLGNTSVTDVKTSGKVTASQFVVNGGTSSQILRADGSFGTLPAAHYVGESYGGGIVFYVYDGGLHGLIAAASDQTTGAPWASNSSRIGGAQVDGIGAGNANTKLIINTIGVNNQSAAMSCVNYYATQNVGGVNIFYTDWYLPSKTEMLLLYQQRSTIGGFVNGGYYWTSQQVNDQDGYAWCMGFTASGDMSSSGQKGLTSIRVRAIRHF